MRPVNMHLVAAIWLLIVAKCYSGVGANDAAGAVPVAAAASSSGAAVASTSKQTYNRSSPEIDAVISSSEIVATGSISSLIVESSGGGGGGGGDADTRSIGPPITIQRQQPSNGDTGITEKHQNGANGSCHGDETQSSIRKLAADEYHQQQQQQLQYSNSRLLLRFLVISLFILVSLSLFTVYAIKFCLCQRRAQPGAAGSQRRRPKPATTRNFLALNLRRCNLIADAASTHDQDQNYNHHHHHHHAHLLPPHGRCPPQDVHYGQPLDRRQAAAAAAAAAAAPLQCSCFHPDLIGSGGAGSSILDAGQQLASQSRLAAPSGSAAEQCVWWCQAQHFASNPFGGQQQQQPQPQPPDQLLNCQQIVSLAHEQTAAAAAPPAEPCVQSEEQAGSMLPAQGPPAYSDIYSSSGSELLTSSAARAFNLLTNSTATTTTQQQQLADANGSHQFQQSMIDTHRQKSLLVKLNLNKTRVLSPEELMLLSRLIDVPIVVQQQQQQQPEQPQQDPSVGVDLSARTAAAAAAAAAEVTAAGAIDDEALEEETDDNRQESR